MNTNADYSIWFGLVGIGLLAGCSLADGEPPVIEETESDHQQRTVISADVNPVGDIIYHDNVYEISDGVASEVRLGDDGTIIQVPIDHAGKLADASSGDIVFSDHDEQRFRLRISEVQSGGDTLTLRGDIPPVEEVVKTGTFRATVEFGDHRDNSPEELLETDRIFDMNQGQIVDARIEDGDDGPQIQRIIDEASSVSDDDDIGQVQQAMNSRYTGSEFWEVATEIDNSHLSGSAANSIDINEFGIDTRDEQLFVELEYRINSYQVSLQHEAYFEGEATYRGDFLIDPENGNHFSFSDSWSGYNSTPKTFEVSLVGGDGEYEYDVYVGMDAFLEVEGSGDGEYHQEFHAESIISSDMRMIRGGHPWSHSSSSVSDVTASHSNEAQNDDVEAEIEAGLLIRTMLHDSVDNQIMENTQGEMHFEGEGTTLEAACPWESTLSLLGYAQTFSPDSFSDSDVTAFDDNGHLPATDDIECRPAPGECLDDGDCPDMTTCSGANPDNDINGLCVADGDLDIHLQWGDQPQPDANLELNVQTPHGEIINYANPVASNGQMIESTCVNCDDENGTSNDDGPDQSVFHERVVYDDASSGEEFIIWVQNNESGGISDVDDLGFSLALEHQDGDTDIFSESYYGTVPASYGARSVYFVYEVP